VSERLLVPGRGAAVLRILAIYAMTTGLVATLILLAPPIPPEREASLCAKSVHVAEYLSFTWSCDSGMFTGLAAQPSRLFEDDGRMWQSRPLLIGAGHLASWPFRAVTDRPYLPVWLGFVLINAVLVIAAAALFHLYAQGDWAFSWSTFFLASLLLSSDVFKAYFWTPHSQMFNLLVPSLALLASQRTFETGIPRLRTIGSVGLATGVAALAYGSFAIVAGAVAAPLLLQHREPLLARLAKTTLLVFSFLAPVLAWIAAVRWWTGELYSHEIEKYRQFVWIADAASAGATALLAEIGQKVGDYVADLSRVAVLPLVLFGVTASIAFAEPSSRRLDRDQRTGLMAALVVVLLSTGFFGFLGYSSPRLAWNTVPPILGCAAILARDLPDGRARRTVRLLFAAVAFSALAWQIVNAGPYS
jgi:hypothetical protein